MLMSKSTASDYALEDTRRSDFCSERRSESKAIQNKTISGARVFLATKVFVWERGFFLAPRFFLPKYYFFERMHIFLFPKNEGNNLTESAMPYYSDYVWFSYLSQLIRTFSP